MPKILIVEDDPMLAEIYEKKFTQSGFNVDIATNGSDAEEKVRQGNPQLMLLDLVLPQEDGFEVLKKIKQDSKIKDTKVVIFSNLSQEEDRQKAKSLGADGFIAKSDFTPQQIVQEVEKILSLEGSREAEVESKKTEKAKTKSRIFKSGKGDSGRVLIIEDEEVFIEVFGKKLQDEGFQVDSATNGAWGIKRIEEQKFDVIILDVLMPAIDGIGVIKKTRQGGINFETPIVVLSNSIEEDRVGEILKAGANDFSVKTRVTPSELTEKIKDLIKSSK